MQGLTKKFPMHGEEHVTNPMLFPTAAQERMHKACMTEGLRHLLAGVTGRSEDTEVMKEDLRRSKEERKPVGEPYVGNPEPLTFYY